MHLVIKKTSFIDSRIYPIISPSKKNITKKTKYIWIQKYNNFIFKYDFKNRILLMQINRKDKNPIIKIEKHLKIESSYKFKQIILKKLLKNFWH